MRINKLFIQNFRNHKDTAVALDKLNIFVGHNNSGKSSILAAIEWALTGRNMWTDRAGRGANDLIAQGEKTCQVALALEGFGGIVRELPPHSLTAGKFQGVLEGQAAICNFLEADEKLIQLVLNAGAFVNMSPAEQKAFLFGLCGISFSPDAVKKAVLALTGNEEVAKRAVDLVPGKMDGNPRILEGMDKRAREMRKETKKELERTKAALAEMELPNLPDGIGLEDKEKVARQLVELEREKDKLLKALGESQATQKNKTYLQDKYNALADEIKRLTDEKENKSARLTGIDKKMITNRLNELKKQTEQVKNMAYTFDQEILKLENELAVKIPIVEALNGFNGKCPLAPELINCSMTNNEINNLAKKLNTECDTTNKNIKKIANERTNLTKYGEKIITEFEKLEELTTGLAKAENEISLIDMTVERSKKELAEVKEELTRIEEAKTNKINPGLQEAIEEKIAEGRKILSKLDLAEYGRKQSAQLQADLKILQKEVEILDALVKTLGPDGIRKNLFGGQLEEFTRQLNGTLALITEGRYQLNWNGDFTPMIGVNGSLLPIRLLSKSEQHRVGVAFQTAIAKQAGLKFLAVDEVDMLDQDNRDLLTGAMIDQMEEFDQAMMFCTVGDVEPQNPGLPGIRMFWVEDGSIKEVN